MHGHPQLRVGPFRLNTLSITTNQQQQPKKSHNTNTLHKRQCLLSMRVNLNRARTTLTAENRQAQIDLLIGRFTFSQQAYKQGITGGVYRLEIMARHDMMMVKNCLLPGAACLPINRYGRTENGTGREFIPWSSSSFILLLYPNIDKVGTGHYGCVALTCLWD